MAARPWALDRWRWEEAVAEVGRILIVGGGIGGLCLAAALEGYAARRRPRTQWVQDQSRIAARAWVLPPAVRSGALRERGDQMLRDRYRPLIPPP
jgi:hypothetical protein